MSDDENGCVVARAYPKREQLIPWLSAGSSKWTRSADPCAGASCTGRGACRTLAVRRSLYVGCWDSKTGVVNQAAPDGTKLGCAE